LFNQRKLAKMQWLQDSHQCNTDNLNNVICQASRHFWNKKKEYLTAKVDELDTVRSNISETCIGASFTFTGVTSLELV
jgi:hypothetical protein